MEVGGVSGIVGEVEFVFQDGGIAVDVDVQIADIDALVDAGGIGLRGDGGGFGLGGAVGVRVGEVGVIELAESGGVAFQCGLLPGVESVEDVFFGGVGGEGWKGEEQQGQRCFHVG